MKKKDYMQPTTQVVLLQHESHLLAGSATKPDYGSESWSREDDFITNEEDL